MSDCCSVSSSAGRPFRLCCITGGGDACEPLTAIEESKFLACQWKFGIPWFLTRNWTSESLIQTSYRSTPQPNKQARRLENQRLSYYCLLPAGKETAFQSGLNNLGILVILIHIYIVVFFVIVCRKCHLKCFLFLTKEFQRFQNASPRTGPSLVHYSTQVGRCSCIFSSFRQV